MKTFEPNKNAKQLGIDTTKKFVVVDGEGIFPQGTILTLEEDDGSSCPRFTDGKKIDYAPWFRLAYAEKNWDTLEAGDIIVNKYTGSKSKILAVLGDVFLMSCWDDFEYAVGWRTKTEAQKDGYTIENTTPTEDEEVENAIKLLEKKGRIVDGKIIK